MSTRKYSSEGKIPPLDKNGSSIGENPIQRESDGKFRNLSATNKIIDTVALSKSSKRIPSEESESSVEILSDNSQSQNNGKISTDEEVEKLKEENEILQGKLKCYQTLGKLYEETKEELKTIKANYSSKSDAGIIDDDFLNSKDSTYKEEHCEDYNSFDPESIPSNPPTLDDIRIEMQNDTTNLSNGSSLPEREVSNQFQTSPIKNDDQSEISSSSHKDEDRIKKAISIYQEYMKQKFYGTSTLEKDVIKQEHKQAFSHALKAAKHCCSEAQLEDILKPYYQKLVQENNTVSREKCHLLVQHVFSNIEAAIKDNKYMTDNGYDCYIKDRNEAIEKYKKNPGKGPMANHVLEEYLHKRIQDEKRIQHLQHFDNDDQSMTWDDNDVMTHVQTICDTMSKGLDEPESLESMHVGKELIAFSVRAIKMEKQQKKYRTLVETLYDEIEKMKHEFQQVTLKKDDEISSLRKEIAILRKIDFPPEEAEISETPSTSLTMPEKEWIHIVENETAVEEEGKQYKCDEATDREIEFRKKIRIFKDQLKEFARANKNWENHCNDIQEHFKVKHRSLLDEVNTYEDKIKHLEEERQNVKSEYEQKIKSAEEKMQDCENQRIKAVNFASSQASKVDEYKKTVKAEKVKNKDLEDKVQQLQSILEMQKEEIDRLHIQVQHAKDNDISISNVHLTMDNRPPVAESMQRQQDVSLRRSPAERLDSMQNMNLVLKQQITIYKEDFDKERQDRERAQSELSTIRNTFGQLNADCSHFREELQKATIENEAIKAAREYDRTKLQKKQDEINRLTTNLNDLSRKNRDLQTKVDDLKRQIHQQQQPPPYEYNPITSPRRQQFQQTQEQYIIGPGPRIRTVQPLTEILPESWKRKIQSNLQRFSMNLRPDDVVIQLYSKGIISYTDKQNIEAERTEYKRSERLIFDVILRGTKSDLATFRQILIDTDQVDLALLLPTDNTSQVREKWNCIVCTFENSGNRTECEMCRTTAPRLGAVRQPPAYHNLPPHVIPRGVDQCDDTEWVVPAQARDIEMDDDHIACSENTNEEERKTSPKILEIQ